MRLQYIEMTYFGILAFKAQFFLWILSFNLIKSKNIHGNTPNTSVFLSLIEKYLKPFIESFKLHTQNPLQRSFDETLVNKIIDQKVAELKPFLQDDDGEIDTEENITLNGKEETTIIEFQPKNYHPKNIFREGNEIQTELFKKDIKQYKKLRERIKNALDKETVSDKTKNLVTKTFDDILAQLISSKCTWRSVDRPESEATRSTEIDSLLQAIKVATTDWEKFTKKYLNGRNNEIKPLLLFDEFHNILAHVVNNTQKLLDHCKVKCRLVETNHQNKPKQLRIGPVKTTEDKESCINFKLCSNELKEFMREFYKSLNDTAVNTFRNYAAMYGKDVNEDEEKGNVISIIDKASDMVEVNVSKIFRKETTKIKLDETKNVDANIMILKRYIKNTIDHVKKHIKKHMEENLKSLKARLLLAIIQDISVNLNVDLRNLEREFTGRICNVFASCNGRYLSKSQRKVFDPLKDVKETNVFVKVEITMDDDLNDVLRKHKRRTNETIGRYKDAKNGIDIEKYINIQVTRTTFRNVGNKNDLKTIPTTEINSDVKKDTIRNINSTIVEVAINNHI